MTHHPDVAAPQLMFPAWQKVYQEGEHFAYALLRAGFGFAMLTHGLPKLLGTPHGSMTDPVGGAIALIETRLGLPFAPQLATLITGLETIGAAMLMAGFMTRLVAPMFAVQMVFICVALRANFVWIDRGYEYPMMLGLIALLLAFRGGDRFSVDRFLAREL